VLLENKDSAIGRFQNE